MGHQSPLALWMQGALLHLDNTGHDAINMEPFGVDHNGPIGEIENENNVQVLFINALLNPDALNHLQTLCDPLMMVIMA